MAGEGEKTGLIAAIADVGAGDVLPDVAMPVQPAKRGPGRAAGARNRSTAQWRQMLLSRYRSPLIALLEIASRSPRELAEDLGLYERVAKRVPGDGDAPGYTAYKDRLATGEAFKAQLEALKGALPYLHQKQPIAIEPKGSNRGLLVMDFGQFGGIADGAGDFELPLAEHQENQPLIEMTPEKSDDEKSDANKKG